ncbi:MAG: NAD(P)/FAD-dependent oxidoreductase [Burkholderiales bacterium]|nr:NAD(P)/FAD-dependent oxidoreductase [Burkholderiales bacterium]
MTLPSRPRQAARRALLGAGVGVGLGLGLGLAAQLGVAMAGGTARRQVVVLGAGWAGLAAAHALRQFAGELDVHLLDRARHFRALPLSSAWLVGRTPERLPQVALADWAAGRGLRFTAAEVSAIDHERRLVHAGGERLRYDWLLLAGGIAYDYGAWFGSDERAAQQARSAFPAGFVASELDALRQRLQAFEGGTLVTTVPAGPLRCPPAPYERAVLLSWWLRSRGLRAKLVVLDAGGGMPRFNRLFASRHAGWIEHHTHQTVRHIDPFAKTIGTDDGDLRFEHAMLLPPLRAGALFDDAALLARDSAGHGTGWAAVQPLTLRSSSDERVWIAGDALGLVSSLFGTYPKTAQIAAETGAAAAAQIAAASRGLPPPPTALPAGACHVWLDAEPPEQLQIEVSHRLRGDGVIAQTVRQIDNPQPRDEDLQWARELMARRLGMA